MVFSSGLFLFLFLPIVLVLYYLLPKCWRNTLLLAASIFFYTWGEPRFIFILLISITIDFFLAKAMDRSDNPIRRYWLSASLLLNIGLLVYFKYTNFFIENIQDFYKLLNLKPFEWHRVALPIGISFVTFQKISYMVDVYRKEHEPQQRWSQLALYILLFPQLIAGPIIRYKDIAGQLLNRSSNENVENRLNGLFRFIVGLSKKILVANVLAQTVDAIFAINPSLLPTSTVWLGMLAYTMQIYYDFSGYSDMALGLSQMFGFHFPENFNFPYISQNFTEFWRRWHITLGNWMKDYLYIPLGGNRCGKHRTYLNLVIVFFLSGLWHGAAWTFVVWGLYHGLFLVLDKLGLKKITKKLGRVPAILLTFLFVMIGWVIFRAESLTYASSYIVRLFSFSSVGRGLCIDNRFIATLIVAILLAFSGIFQNIEIGANNLFLKSKNNLSWTFIGVLMVILYIINGCSLLAGGFNPFIYFRF